MDQNLQHYGEAIEEVAKQVEASNRFTANRLYNQDIKITTAGIRGGIGGGLNVKGGFDGSKLFNEF